MDLTRPPLGYEYEIAIAKVDTESTLSFAETSYVPISGSFELVTCTKKLDIKPPTQKFKALKCGYNPAAQLIPTVTIPGSLSFSGLDRAQTGVALRYNGFLCVAQVVVKVDDTVVRTTYCNYFQPTFTISSSDSDEPGTISAEGEFTLLLNQ